MVALLAYRQWNWQAVARGRERAGGKGCVRTRRIFEAIEVEDQFTGFVEAIRWEAGVKKTACLVGRFVGFCIGMY